MCTRLGVPVAAQVQELAAELLGEAAPGPAPGEPPPAGPAPELSGVRVVQITLSQLFRMADLLTLPESVKARDFLKTVRDPKAMRRTLNKRKAFELGSLGSMQQVAFRGDDFWRASVPDLRRPGISPLFFLPFELPLSGRLARLCVAQGSLLEGILTPGGAVENRQIEGRLRIYPPGTGVVQISVTLTFRAAVDVDMVARIAQHLEDLLFVDPEGQQRPSDAFFLDVIDQVHRSLFRDEPPNRLWMPAHTVFSFRDAQGFDPEPSVGALARLMSLAPGNEERTGFLASRLEEAFRSAQWQKEKTLALAGQGVALLIAALEPRERRARRLALLADTRELVSAAVYAEQAFIRDLDQIVEESRLDATWLPGQGDGFAYMRQFVEALREVMQAIALLRFLQDHPVRALNTFAKDVWTYSNPVRPALLRQRLAYVADWYDRAAEAGPEVAALQKDIERILEIRPPYPYPDDQEDTLFDQVEQVYGMLRGEEDRPDEIERGLREARKLGRRLGLKGQREGDLIARPQEREAARASSQAGQAGSASLFTVTSPERGPTRALSTGDSRTLRHGNTTEPPSHTSLAPLPESRPRKVRLFYSYAHDDEELRNLLEEHLSSLHHRGLIESWHDRQIPPGGEWDEQIDENLERADVILLLVSSSFLASKYAWGVEVTRAMERYEERTARVIPVILRPVDWEGLPFSKLQALPKKGKPITEWPTWDAGFYDVALGIRRTVEELRDLLSFNHSTESRDVR